jgi:enoyl-[acyl-carrier protein] reductase III
MERQNLVALVTGGSRGIGRAVALLLADNGAQTIIVNYLQNDAEAERTRQLIEAQQARSILIKANLLYPDEIDKLFETVKASVDHLDCFIHCAALGAFKPLREIKPNQWDLTMNINARGFLLCAQKAAALMKEGNIVAISSLGSIRAVPNYGAMGPTKAALESIVRYLAVELAPAGIRVNAVTGGFVETDSIRKFPEAERLIQEVISRTPVKRLGTPEDIAEVVMFLLSPSSRWICGQTIVADGGLSLL